MRFDPYSSEFYEDRWTSFKRMRDEDPVHYIEEYDAWAMFRFDDIWRAGMDMKNFTATFGSSPQALLIERAPQPDIFLFLDTPEHKKHRRLISDKYAKGSVLSLKEKVRAIAQDVLAEMMTGPQPLDVYVYAKRVALYVIADVIGISRDEITYIRGLIDTFFERSPNHRGTTPEGEKAIHALFQYTAELVAKYRSQGAPEGSNLASWLSAEIDGKPLPDESISANMFAISITGSDTIPLATAATIFYLAQHPEQLKAAMQDPSLLEKAFEEAVRFDQPTNILGRRVVMDNDDYGKPLRAGQTVLFMYASAGRDEREFKDADRFDIHRTSARTLSFGSGIHVCLGQHLARLEGPILLQELLGAIPNFKIRTAEVRRVKGEFLQGFCHMPINY